MKNSQEEEADYCFGAEAPWVDRLFDSGLVRRGHFRLPDGSHAPLAFSRRRLCRVPRALYGAAEIICQAATSVEFDVVAATGGSGLALARAVGDVAVRPSVGLPRPIWPFQSKPGNGLNPYALNAYEGRRAMLVETVTTGGDGLRALVHACERGGVYISAVIILMARVPLAPGVLRPETQGFIPLVRTIYSDRLTQLTWQADACQMCRVGLAPLRRAD